MTSFDYVLVTPARNEEKFIGRTISSVVAQTVLPKKWVIISDGSTDRTDEIICDFKKQFDFICFLRSPSAGERSFGSKANAFRTSHEELRSTAYEYIGNLDSDVSFNPNYFEKLLQFFARDSKLGIGGGLIHELVDNNFVPQRTDLNSVAGAVQMFRRPCYEEIGGYIPLRFGGIDSAAEIMARMHGWEVRTFPDLEVRHHRRVGSGGAGLVRTKFLHGMRHYSLGYHPLFELLRNVYRFSDRPYLLGTLLTTVGFFWSFAIRKEMELPEQVIRYLRSEQMERLRALCFGARDRVAGKRPRDS